jgi:hypothetical protein
MHRMASKAMDKILDGDVEVRGRKPGQMDYEPIPRTHWQSSAFFVVEDPYSLWRIKLAPRGGAELDRDGIIVRSDDAVATERNAQLGAYDMFLVDAYQFERAFPRNEAVADKKRRRFLWQARWRRLDKNEIKRLSRS